MLRTDTPTLIAALRALANDIESEDGVANAAITEAADRLEELDRKLKEVWETLYGHNLGVVGWHLNGELEPIDNFFESNDWSRDR